jgi:hypothetical protein
MKAIVRLVGPLVPHTGFFARPEVAAFFHGDLLRGRPLTELWCASTIGALTVWIMYRIALLFLARRTAVGLALLFGFGTSEWSVASRNLFPHGLTLLLLSAALYFLLRSLENPPMLYWTALFLALSFTVRPSNAISCLAIALYVAKRRRQYLWRFLLCAAPVAAAYFAYYILVRHTLTPVYVSNWLNPMPPLEGAMMHLFSPSRGLFVYTPVALFSIAGAVIACLRRSLFPVTPYLIAIVVAHGALVIWGWPGHCYGPRFFADITHLLILFLIPAIEWWRQTQGAPRRAWAAAFALAAAWGVFTHARGGTSIAANQWSALPVNVDNAKWRVWDWRDPQFLRGLR